MAAWLVPPPWVASATLSLAAPAPEAAEATAAAAGSSPSATASASIQNSPQEQQPADVTLTSSYVQADWEASLLALCMTLQSLPSGASAARLVRIGAYGDLATCLEAQPGCSLAVLACLRVLTAGARAALQAAGRPLLPCLSPPSASVPDDPAGADGGEASGSGAGTAPQPRARRIGALRAALAGPPLPSAAHTLLEMAAQHSESEVGGCGGNRWGLDAFMYVPGGPGHLAGHCHVPESLPAAREAEAAALSAWRAAVLKAQEWREQRLSEQQSVQQQRPQGADTHVPAAAEGAGASADQPATSGAAATAAGAGAAGESALPPQDGVGDRQKAEGGGAGTGQPAQQDGKCQQQEPGEGPTVEPAAAGSTGTAAAAEQQAGSSAAGSTASPTSPDAAAAAPPPPPPPLQPPVVDNLFMGAALAGVSGRPLESLAAPGPAAGLPEEPPSGLAEGHPFGPLAHARTLAQAMVEDSLLAGLPAGWAWMDRRGFAHRCVRLVVKTPRRRRRRLLRGARACACARLCMPGRTVGRWQQREGAADRVRSRLFAAGARCLASDQQWHCRPLPQQPPLAPASCSAPPPLCPLARSPLRTNHKTLMGTAAPSSGRARACSYWSHLVFGSEGGVAALYGPNPEASPELQADVAELLRQHQQALQVGSGRMPMCPDRIHPSILLQEEALSRCMAPA